MFYKTEMHCHTSDNDVSRCSHENAIDTVQDYVDAGYTTVVLTNHINGATKYVSDREFTKAMENFIDTYNIFKTAADGKLNTLFGFEVNFANIPVNDFLVYGLEPEFLLKYPDLREYKLKRFHEIVNENGGIVVQAHPFRPYTRVISPDQVDGIEVFNGHPTHQNHNDIADRWANYYNLIKTSGSDHHDKDHKCSCGIATDFPITTNKELIDILHTNTKYRLIRFERPNATMPHII